MIPTVIRSGIAYYPSGSNLTSAHLETMLVLQMIAALRRARQGIAVMYVQISKAEYERHGKVLEAQQRREAEK